MLEFAFKDLFPPYLCPTLARQPFLKEEDSHPKDFTSNLLQILILKQFPSDKKIKNDFKF